MSVEEVRGAVADLTDQPEQKRTAEHESLGDSGHEAVMRIPVSVKIVLGSARLTVGKLLTLRRGSVIALDQKIGGPVDIVVNERLVARGEVVVLDDEGTSFAVSVSEVVKARPE